MEKQAELQQQLIVKKECPECDGKGGISNHKETDICYNCDGYGYLEN